MCNRKTLWWGMQWTLIVKTMHVDSLGLGNQSTHGQIYCEVAESKDRDVSDTTTVNVFMSFIVHFEISRNRFVKKIFTSEVILNFSTYISKKSKNICLPTHLITGQLQPFMLFLIKSNNKTIKKGDGIMTPLNQRVTACTA